MALNIKEEHPDRLARELASATGESVTTAARTAIEERLARVPAEQRRAAPGPALVDVIRRGRARAELVTGSADEVVGYDEGGLPA